jgi:dual specificity MAP kinase phosphatase
LTAIAPRLLSESPACVGYSLEQITDLLRDEPKWLPGLDGSFPSRILDYLYLGNLGHANNPDLLKELGIGQILSVGETASWRDGELEEWGSDNVYVVQGVQDNGIDPLTNEFPGCLEFIGENCSGPLDSPLTTTHNFWGFGHF